VPYRVSELIQYTDMCTGSLICDAWPGLTWSTLHPHRCADARQPAGLDAGEHAMVMAWRAYQTADPNKSAEIGLIKRYPGGRLLRPAPDPELAAHHKVGGGRRVDKKWAPALYDNLYRASDILSTEHKITLGLLIPVDVYVQDPFVAKQNERNGSEFDPCPRRAGAGGRPTSARIAVVDYDGDRHKLEDPAYWDAKSRCFTLTTRAKSRSPASTADKFQFHQVNVWAIIQSVLDIYEATWVLGRSAPWAFEGNRLIVVPHAGYLANAFYDRRSKSIQFYYFGTKERVYTCLSHDIIAHETGHAILDGLRPATTKTALCRRPPFTSSWPT